MLAQLKYFILKKQFDFASFILGTVIGSLPLFIYVACYGKYKNWDWKFILAILTAFFALYRYYKENKEKKSKFYLDKYIEASKMILKFIESDKPTRRMAWVSAEKIANKMLMLKEKITEESDKIFLNIYLRSFTHTLLNFLRKPTEYFYGLDSDIITNNLPLEAGSCQICGYNNEPTFSNSLTPKWRESKFVDKNSIKSVIDLIKPTILEETGVIYKNDSEFLNITEFWWPNLYQFIEHMRLHNV